MIIFDCIGCQFLIAFYNSFVIIFSFFLLQVSTSNKGDVLSTPQTSLNQASNASNKGQQFVRDVAADHCPSRTPCEDLGPNCINCNFNYSCTYGKITSVTCEAKQGINCTVRTILFFFYGYILVS